MVLFAKMTSSELGSCRIRICAKNGIAKNTRIIPC